MPPMNLGDLIDRNADPDTIAIIDLSDSANPLHVSYGGLSQRIDSVARSMLARGFEHGDTLAILAANSTDYLCAYYGIIHIFC